MENVSGNSTCIKEEDLKPKSSAVSGDKCQKKNYVEIGMEDNLRICAEDESDKTSFEVNCEIVEEEQELTKIGGDSVYKNLEEDNEEDYLIRKGRKAGMMNSEDENFEDSSKSNKENIQESCHNKKIINKSSTLKKKSKNQIKEERLKIQSETHRLMRERHIKIPYHLPKQRTLKEFLSRKKNRANIPLNTPSFKMVEIWKDIEESTKTASEFFRSDSDTDSEGHKKEVKSKTCEQKCQKTEKKSMTLDDTNIMENTYKIEDNAHCNSSTDKQYHYISSHSIKNSLTLNEPLIIEQNGTEKENEENSVALDKHEENAEVIPCKYVGDATNKQGNSVKTLENSNNPCTDTEILQSIHESNSDDNYTKLNTLDWVKKIPVYEKLLKPNKKEMLLKKINPTLLKITPKLSGESDSVIDLENITNDLEIGAKKFKKRFFKHCLPPRQVMKNEVEMTLTMSENNEKGEISNITTEKLIYHSTESFESIKCEKPGAKLQRLREELQKKIEEKWEEEYKKQIMEAQLQACNKEKEVSEDEEELIEDLEDGDETESLDTESKDDDDDNEDDDDDDYDKPQRKIKKNMFIDNEAEESGCEESGNEGGDELVEDDEESEDGSDGGSDSENDDKTTVNENSAVHKNITSTQTEEILDKDSSSLNAYDTQSSQIPPYQPGGGMLNGGSELSQCDDDNSFPQSILSPTLKLSMDFLHDRKNIASQQSCDLNLELPEVNCNKTSFIPRFPENENFDLNDAYEFCSGKFPDHAEQSQSLMVDSQDPVTSESNELGFNFGFVSARNTSFGYNASKKDEVRHGEKKMVSRLKVLSDSEDEIEIQDTNVNELEHITGKLISSDDSDNDTEKSFLFKNKKTKKHLHFSDEEENSGSEQEKDALDTEDEPLEEEKTGRMDGFSESEVQSSEDDSMRKVEYNSEEEEIVNPREFFEKEAELSGSEWSGDEDERDLDKMEAEDGDEDKLNDKKVRSQLEKIHMRTLLDDDARQVRILQELLFEDGDLFDDGPKRERNFRWKDLGTNFDEDGNGSDAIVSQDQEEVEEDEQSTKQRHEKELFLLNLKSKKEESGLDEDDETISLLKLGKVVLRNSIRSKIASEEKVVCNSSNVTDNISFKAPVAPSKKRGSFLSRNEEFLSRLAKFTLNATDNILGPKHSKNFVFAAKSPEKINHSSGEDSHPKRKGVSPESDGQTKKRAKFEKEVTHQKVSVLDRLV